MKLTTQKKIDRAVEELNAYFNARLFPHSKDPDLIGEKNFPGTKASFDPKYRFENGYAPVIIITSESAEDDYDLYPLSKLLKKADPIVQKYFGRYTCFETESDGRLACYLPESEDLPWVHPLPGEKENPIDLRWDTSDYPEDVHLVMREWSTETRSRPDGGSSIDNEHFTLRKNGKYYNVYPLDGYQGNGREEFVDSIKSHLEAIGCSEVVFDYGYMD